ncbi:CDP-diacylglycerol--glycerol-3-phosphate 3-phosphatidyltransferase [uncultured Eubacterium sp.]|uniref:CDP-diacylglycerol--glycerol-3-phosphate 3-phosphatidyltransferase n=1 Tax=uncultured Eubacterium sp. TaxID=165185 RepID=UPI0025E272D0|nr:CDP-diacylglycerol--glycerol-3-phosphate 3-phosphatidyltransferase [uncultured Eubacterium sp.]
MNLPNKLTIFRVILIPFFVFFLLTDVLGAAGDYLALVIFIVASLTDMLDGKIARKYNLVTNFGKFMDPLADKLLVCSAMICLVDLKLLPSWIVIIIIAREFIISGFRLIAAEHQIVIAASMWGKFKTTFQMSMIILLILNMNFDVYVAGVGIIHVLALIATYVALVLTIVSLIDYLCKNKAVLKEQD